MKIYIIFILLLFLLGCSIEEPIEECIVCEACNVCPVSVCDVCETCDVCEDCEDIDDRIIILEGAKDYEIGMIYQGFADKNIDIFEDFYYDKDFSNCTIELDGARSHLLTASGFFHIADKQFTTIKDNELAKAYSLLATEYYLYNEDLTAYLNIYRDFCRTHTDYDDINVRSLRDAEKWETRSIIHKDNIEKHLRLIMELK